MFQSKTPTCRSDSVRFRTKTVRSCTFDFKTYKKYER